MNEESATRTIHVVVPPLASFDEVCNLANQINRKAEEGNTSFKIEVNAGKFITELARVIRKINSRKTRAEFLIRENDLIKNNPKLRAAFVMVGASFYSVEDEEQEDSSQQHFLSQDFFLLHQRSNDVDTFKEAIIRVTYRCNEDCHFCWIQQHETDVEPSAIKNLIADLLKKDIRHFVFTGGEPTMLKELPELMRFAKDNGAKQIILQTNGVLLADQKRVEELIKCGLDQVFLALHSDKKHIAEEITALNGSFDKTIQALENFLQTDCEVVIDHVLSKSNVEYVESFADLMIELQNKYQRQIAVNFAVGQPMGKYIKTFLEHTPTITQLRKYLLPAMNKLMASAVELKGFSTACGPPICALDGNPELLDNLEKVPGDEWKKDFVKPQACLECTMYDFCWGIRKIYAEHFGTEEIRPVKK